MGISLRQGESVGRWILEQAIGQGGNSEVWKAVDSQGVMVAVKFLTGVRPEATRYKRFVHEIAYQRSLGGRRGVLPLLDSYLPENPSKSDRAWLATPLAEPLRNAIQSRKSNLEGIVSFVCDIANALAQVHAEGAAHRDIKPENLFLFDGGGAVGDFGLVDFPSKESVTSGTERLGPLFYIAPEMLVEAADLDARPADVYSLAKTLWVLATNQHFPIPGELRFDIPQARLSEYVEHRRAVILDKVLNSATRHSPSGRPTMEEFRAELSDWLKQPEPDETLDLSRIEARFRPLVAGYQEFQRVREQRILESQQLMSRLFRFLEEIASPIRQAAGLSVQVFGNTNAMLRHFSYPSETPLESLHRENCSMELFVEMAGDIAYFRSGFVVCVEHDGRTWIKGGHVVERRTNPSHVLYSAEARFVLGTANEEHSLNGLLNCLRATLGDSLDSFANYAAGSGGGAAG